MESPDIIYKQLKQIEKINDVAYTRLFENYLKYDLKEEKKLIEIDSTDQESLIKRFTFGIPIPGMIYTFIHLNEQVRMVLIDDKTGKQNEFHDLTPIVFCTYYNPIKKTLGGLNLTMLPNSERLKFFMAYYDLYEDFFKDVERDTQNNKIAINKRYIGLVLSGGGQKMIKIFNKTQNALFNYAYRSYKLENIRKLRMLEFEEWNYIPFFSPSQAFKKINLEQIYKIYWDNLKKNK
jgi:hypothetical protein